MKVKRGEALNQALSSVLFKASKVDFEWKTFYALRKLENFLESTRTAANEKLNELRKKFIEKSSDGKLIFNEGKPKFKEDGGEQKFEEEWKTYFEEEIEFDWRDFLVKEFEALKLTPSEWVALEPFLSDAK